MAKLYFRDRHERKKAYEILADYNFYFPYGEDCSLKDVDNDEIEYMLELLESDYRYDGQPPIVKED